MATQRKWPSVALMDLNIFRRGKSGILHLFPIQHFQTDVEKLELLK